MTSSAAEVGVLEAPLPVGLVERELFGSGCDLVRSDDGGRRDRTLHVGLASRAAMLSELPR